MMMFDESEGFGGLAVHWTMNELKEEEKVEKDW